MMLNVLIDLFIFDFKFMGLAVKNDISLVDCHHIFVLMARG